MNIEKEISQYIFFKRKYLTEASLRAYGAALKELNIYFKDCELEIFNSSEGMKRIEEFMSFRWGDRSARTYNKNLSIIRDFFKWELRRENINRDPTLLIDRAKSKQIYRTVFTPQERDIILSKNPHPRDQIALRLLLDYGIRKGALQNIQFKHFDFQNKRLVLFSKGEKIYRIPITATEIWDNIKLLNEPEEYFLLPYQVMRKTSAIHKKEINLMKQLIYDCIKISDNCDNQELLKISKILDDINIDLNRILDEESEKIIQIHTSPRGSHGLHDWWYRCLSKANIIPKGITHGQRMHKARHTAGQRVIDKTGNLKAAQKLLGHASLNTTGNTYVDWDLDQLANTLKEVIQ